MTRDAVAAGGIQSKDILSHAKLELEKIRRYHEKRRLGSSANSVVVENGFGSAATVGSRREGADSFPDPLCPFPVLTSYYKQPVLKFHPRIPQVLGTVPLKAPQVDSGGVLLAVLLPPPPPPPHPTDRRVPASMTSSPSPSHGDQSPRTH